MRNYRGDKILVTPSVLYSEEVAMAAIDSGESGYIHVLVDGAMIDWKIFSHDMSPIGEGTEHWPILNSPKSLSALDSLLSFLTAGAEGYKYGPASENYDLFDREISEWAASNSDALTIISVEIEEELGYE